MSKVLGFPVVSAAAAAYGSQIFKEPFYYIWPDCREMIQTKVSGNRHTLLTQLLLTSLLPHSVFVKDGLGVPASSSGDVDEHRLSLWSRLHQEMCHEPDDQLMAAKYLHQMEKAVWISVVTRELCQYSVPCFSLSANERCILFDSLLAKCLFVCVIFLGWNYGNWTRDWWNSPVLNWLLD